MDDFDELLRRAMEAETRDDFEKAEDVSEEEFSKMIDRIGVYGVIQVGSKSREKMRDAVEKLQKELKDLDVKNSTTSLAKAIAVIRKSAKEIEVLNTIMVTSSLSAMAMHGGKDPDAAIDTAVKMISF